MNRSRHAPAVTSLPQAPQDEAAGRVRRYVLTMVIRMVCFGLTIFVTPYGWYTWVFALATAVLPYIAVVFANAISPTTTSSAESATEQIAPVSSAPAPMATDPHIITIHEAPRLPAAGAEAPHPAPAQPDEGERDDTA